MDSSNGGTKSRQPSDKDTTQRLNTTACSEAAALNAALSWGLQGLQGQKHTCRHAAYEAQPPALLCTSLPFLAAASLLCPTHPLPNTYTYIHVPLQQPHTPVPSGDEFVSCVPQQVWLSCPVAVPVNHLAVRSLWGNEVEL